jgi:formylglycine-generating enzyme required for sulfatase activity
VVKEITNTLGMRLTLIPHGTFPMGSPATDKDAVKVGVKSETPQHDVEITRSFYLAVCPVTVGQFREFVEDTKFKDKKYLTEPERDDKGGFGYDAKKKQYEGPNRKYSWKNTGWPQTDEHPVVNVTWNDAVAFCKWLSKKEGRTYDLPFEAEWEYACRAGATTRYHFGDDAALLGKYAWYWKNADKRTHEVGTQQKPNVWGLYDMHGNVWQWCADGPRKYDENPVKDPKGPLDGNSRVARGGSWHVDSPSCRAACRESYAASTRDADMGFRVLLRPGTP